MNFEEKAIELIPELEEYFTIDMSMVSFEKKDLPAYFNIKNINNKDVIYNFETNFGGAEIVLKNVFTDSESITWNNVLQIHLDQLENIKQ
tara:strand:- start:832 stop:1101 length:270 start_codon:yes stop_codon:yes gene_type:complete